ncbi:MAG: hypothetical protein COB22_06665 [Cycloclasticus sp.]|nr:MAG: hypothetical protein COB22_06665 [Cycloclasticus sp.]
MLSQLRPINKSFCLQTLCEENFTRLIRLTPNLGSNNTSGSIIQTEILDTGPFTYTLILRDKLVPGQTPHINFKCRVYMDTKSMEVIQIVGHWQTPNFHKTTPKDILNRKWESNYFLEKWLVFQLDMSNVTQTSQQVANV